MLLLAGIALLIWVLFRRNLKLRARGRQHDREAARQQKAWASQANSGAPLADAPASVARWQAGMFDLQRDLKAELDTKIAVLHSMVRLADQRIAQLSQLPGGAQLAAMTQTSRNAQSSPATNASDQRESPASPLAQQAEEVSQLTTAGLAVAEIARRTGLSLGDVEFLQGLSRR